MKLRSKNTYSLKKSLRSIPYSKRVSSSLHPVSKHTRSNTTKKTVFKSLPYKYSVTKRSHKRVSRKSSKRDSLHEKEEKRNSPIVTPPESFSRGNIKQKLEVGLRSPNRRLREYLSRVCPWSQTCLAFGRDIPKVKSYFGSFEQFDFLRSGKIATISSGSNGFVNSLVYDREGYISHAIMKTSIVPDESDSLVYEAFVGLTYLNKQLAYFPCFVETYSILKTNTDTNPLNKNVSKYMKTGDFVHDVTQPLTASNPSTGNMSDIFSPVKLSDALLSDSCDHAELYTILVEYLDRPVSVGKWLRKERMMPHTMIECIGILYQVYGVLGVIANEFTHYDLHDENVLLYTIPNNGYVTMRYIGNTPDTTVEFNTRYIAKVIDYGRCFTQESQHFYDNMCRLCPTDCGYSAGYGWFKPKISKRDYYIASNIRNISHDLRLARTLSDYIIPNSSSPPLTSELNHLLKTVIYDTRYGTPEIMPGQGVSTRSIHNVVEMKSALEHLINSTKYKENVGSIFSPENKTGTMTIYMDRSRDMVFTAE